MLRGAMRARRALLLLDGMDEGGRMRTAIERHVTEVLAPQGHVVLVTSRPEGVNTAKYKGRFVIMNLNALSNEQQRAAVSVQMHGSEFFEHLGIDLGCELSQTHIYNLHEYS
jgi:hypothetical protein